MAPGPMRSRRGYSGPTCLLAVAALALLLQVVQYVPASVGWNKKRTPASRLESLNIPERLRGARQGLGNTVESLAQQGSVVGEELNAKVLPVLKDLAGKAKDGGISASERLAEIYATMGRESLGPAIEKVRLNVLENKMASTARKEIGAAVKRGRSAAGAKLAGWQGRSDAEDGVMTTIATAQRLAMPGQGTNGEQGSTVEVGTRYLLDISSSTAEDVRDRILSTKAGFGFEVNPDGNVRTAGRKVGPSSEEVRRRLEASAADIEEALIRVAPALSGAHEAIETSAVKAVQEICTAAASAAKQIQTATVAATARIQILTSQVANITRVPRQRVHALASSALRRVRPAAVIIGQNIQTGFRKIGPAMANSSIRTAVVEAGQQIQVTMAVAALQIEDAVREIDTDTARSEVRQRVQDFADAVQRHIEVAAGEALDVLGLERKQAASSLPMPSEFPEQESANRAPLNMLLIAIVVVIWAGFGYFAVGRERSSTIASRYVAVAQQRGVLLASSARTYVAVAQQRSALLASRAMPVWRRITIRMARQPAEEPEQVVEEQAAEQPVEPASPTPKVVKVASPRGSPRPSGVMQGIGGN